MFPRPIFQQPLYRMGTRLCMSLTFWMLSVLRARDNIIIPATKTIETQKLLHIDYYYSRTMILYRRVQTQNTYSWLKELIIIYNIFSVYFGQKNLFISLITNNDDADIHLGTVDCNEGKAIVFWISGGARDLIYRERPLLEDGMPWDIRWEGGIYRPCDVNSSVVCTNSSVAEKVKNNKFVITSSK